MAATNFTPIQLYHSSTASAAPSAGNLANGELAINITDGKLYYKDNAGAVQVIATKGAGTIGGSTTQIQYNNAGALAGNAAMTFNSGTSTTTLTTLNLTNALGAIYGGTAQSTYTQGDILYSSATNTLSKLGIGTVDYILTSTGSVPQWSAPSSISVLTATNLAGGLAGSVPYQSAVNTTTFLAIGAANRVMTSTGSAPQWVTALTGLTGVSSSSITNTSLTSGRVVYSGASGVQTDSSNLTFNGTTLSAGGYSTTGLTTLVQTVTIGNSNFSGTAVFAPTTPAKLYIGTGTVTDTTSAIGATNATGAVSSLAITPIAATNTSVTYTNAATLYIAGAPSAGTNVTLTNPYALYVAGGTSYFGGSVVYAGGINLNGNVTVGDSSSDTLTINSTITSNLIFTDNTYDIGASGATRPRTLYLGTSLITPSITNSGLSNGRVVLAGSGGLLQDSANLTFSSNVLGLAGSQSITGSNNATYTLSVTNDASGTSYSGSGKRLAFFRTSTSAAADQPGIDIGYDISGVSGIIAGSTNGTGTAIAFWTYDGADWGERGRFAKSGYFGLGTNNPQSKLHIQSTAGTAETLITLQSGYSSPSGNKSIAWTDGTGRIGAIGVNYTAPQGAMTFGSLYNSGYNTTDLMVLTPAVLYTVDQINVGIGSASPEAKLTVIKDLSSAGDATGFRLNSNTTSDRNILFGGPVSSLDAAFWQSYKEATTGAGNRALLLNPLGGNVGIGVTVPNTKLELRTDTTTADSAPSILLNNRVAGTTAYYAGGIFGGGYRDVRDPAYIAGIDFYRDSASSGLASSGSIRFYTEGNGETLAYLRANGEKMRLTYDGTLLVGDTGNAIGSKVYVNGGSGEGVGILVDSVNSTRPLVLWNSAASGNRMVQFYTGTGPAAAGSIESSGSTTTYNTSSDYRLKNITGPITNSGAYIDSLNPVEGTWKASGSAFVGLLAHEVQEASRTFVATGVKDGEEMQGLDYSSGEIIANLIAEIQSLRKRLADAGI